MYTDKRPRLYSSPVNQQVWAHGFTVVGMGTRQHYTKQHYTKQHLFARVRVSGGDLVHSQAVRFDACALDPAGQELHRRVLHSGIAMDVVRSSGTRTPHRHTCLEIVFVHAGTTIWHVNGYSHVLVPGDVLVFNAESVHSSRPVHGQYVRTGIHFLADLVAPSIVSQLPRPQDAPWVVSLPSPQAHQLFVHAQQLRSLTRHVPTHPRSRDLLTSILVGLADHALHPARNGPPDDDVLRAAVRYMGANLDTEESLSQLAERVHVSEGHLCHLFRKRFGCPPKRLWQYMKIERICASFYIAHSSVDELARRTGFATRRGFERAFRRVTGTTVTEYRSLLASG